MTGKSVGIEHANKVLPIYSIHRIIAWLLMLLNRFLIEEDVCFSSETCGEVLIITSCRFFADCCAGLGLLSLLREQGINYMF